MRETGSRRRDFVTSYSFVVYSDYLREAAASKPVSRHHNAKGIQYRRFACIVRADQHVYSAQANREVLKRFEVSKPHLCEHDTPRLQKLR